MQGSNGPDTTCLHLTNFLCCIFSHALAFSLSIPQQRFGWQYIVLLSDMLSSRAMRYDTTLNTMFYCGY